MPDSSPQTSQPLLQEFLNLLREKKYSENSLQSHRLDLQKYLDWLGDGGEVRLEQLQVLKPADIQDRIMLNTFIRIINRAPLPAIFLP